MTPTESLPLALDGLELVWESVAVVLGALALGLVAGLLLRRRPRPAENAPVRLHERELESLRRVASDLARAGDI
jgi:hypothetical protein